MIWHTREAVVVLLLAAGLGHSSRMAPSARLARSSLVAPRALRATPSMRQRTSYAEQVVTLAPNVAVELSEERDLGARRTDGSAAWLFEQLPSVLTCSSVDDGVVVLGVHDRDGVERSYRAVDLGVLCAERFLALSRVKRWWMGPVVGSRSGNVPVETQLLLARCPGESASAPPLYFALLPLVSGGFRATLCGNILTNKMSMHIDSGDSEVRTARMDDALVIAASADPYDAVRRATRAAAERVPDSFRVREDKVPPRYLDSFGWCTWDAFYSAVNPEAVLRGVRSLRDGGAPARFLILDDGWQTVDGGERNRVGLAFPLRSPRAALEEYLRGLNASMQETMLAVARFSAGNRTLSEFVSDLAESSPWDVLSAAAPAQPPPSAPPKAANPAAELTSSAMNLAMRLFTAFYATFVAPAPYDSLIARLWRWASAGPLRANLIAFFDEHTDFSKSLVSFAPNAKFSDGGDAGGGLPGVKPSLSLASMVSQLRSELGIRTVYAWHALGGYWSGVSPIAPEMAPLEPEWRFPEPARDLLMVEPAVLWDPSSFHGAGTIDPSHFDRFFDGVHGALAAAGVDGVKVDAQSGIAVFGSGWGLGQPAYVRRAVRAMERSARAHFSRGGREGESASEVICCMCHSSENLLSFHDAAVVRCGDDFYPNDEASHAAHITTVAYNSVLLGELAVPDWDMFQSAGTAADLHAAARALGGGAIYVSDKPGEHCFELLRQLVLPDGSTLRALRAGRPTVDCLFDDVARDGRTALKVWNSNAVTGLLGAFNVQGSEWSRRLRRFVQPLSPRAPVPLTLSPSLVAEPRFQAGQHALYSFRTSELRAPVGAGEAQRYAQLREGEWDIFTVAPVQTLSLGRAGSGPAREHVAWAPLGLLRMLNGGGAVVEARTDADGRAAIVRARGCGTFGMFVSRAPAEVAVGGARVSGAQHDAHSNLLRFELGELPAEGELHEIVVRF